MSRYEDGTRRLVTRLIDAFVEDGRCEFMDAFARPLPGPRVLRARAARRRGRGAGQRPRHRGVHPDAPRRAEAWQGMASWIGDLVAAAGRGPRGDVVDAVLAAEIEAARSPITRSSGSSSC